MADVSSAIDRRKYRKVYARLWTNRDFQQLNDSEKVMALYILSGPQTNRIGLFRVSLGAVADDLGISMLNVKRRLESVCAAFGWEFDESARVIWIPSWWHFNPPAEKALNFKGYLTDLGEVPHTPLICRFCRNLGDIPASLHPLVHAWSVKEHCSDTGRTTELELEKEKELEKELERETAPTCAEPPSDSTPPILEFPVVGTAGHTWGLPRTLVEAWVHSYPNVDVLAECRKAHAWIHANPGRRKTVSGMPKFLVGWLNRAVDSGRSPAVPAPSNSFIEHPKSRTVGNAANLQAFINGGRRD